MYTEAQAREKVCPILSLKQEGEGLINTNNCYVSECMAWRWINGDGWADGESERKGYCGLAGKP